LLIRSGFPIIAHILCAALLWLLRVAHCSDRRSPCGGRLFPSAEGKAECLFGADVHAGSAQDTLGVFHLADLDQLLHVYAHRAALVAELATGETLFGFGLEAE